ncbi:hypothetical protein M378DRAFT_188578 [Amanita muscaria Koide BX008]|uniref:Uncharacterized protein n=1 Tax=Amanita muscaria (strain Koide BX008) TaxID=946122 RepID=A0A0C2W5A8_AMAMK|nr:hypothetical protein M378DRAFT_188578 [Amanita muscaria Koide BX008]
MNEAKTSRMWGIFDESGVFLSLCHHGFVLLVVDMVRSGELAKYPLATVNALLSAFGPNLGVGYDIGCQFQTSVSRSPLQEQAASLKLTPLVGSFHGHAHNRLCQLSHLSTYVKGVGLEDLEGCEQFFSKSNALANCTRYASTFHRQQEITLFFNHVDNYDTYPNLIKFLVDNYYHVLEILQGEETLRLEMAGKRSPIPTLSLCG